MSSLIVLSEAPITLVGGGLLAEQDINAACALAPRLVAADSGAGRALDFGHHPEAVIGDLDSLSATDRVRFTPEQIHQIAEQDSTDFQKALSRIEAPLILAVGFLGGRVDHQLAALHAILEAPRGRVLLVGRDDIIFHLPPKFEMLMPKDARVSLFPMQPVTGRSIGLKWPIDGLALAPGKKIATSNCAMGQIEIETDGPGLLALLPRETLEQTVERLLQADQVNSGG